MGDQINLKWNDFEENVRVAFKDFRSVLSDVVLYCGGQKTSANRLVLCASSEVFKSMLLGPEMSKQQCPSVLLWETSMAELNLILDFMYFGEVKVSEAGLTSFLALAERLQVKGLCGKDGGGRSTPREPGQRPVTIVAGKRKEPQEYSVPVEPEYPAEYPVLEEISSNEGRKQDWSTHTHTPKRSRQDHSAQSSKKSAQREQSSFQCAEIKQELIPSDFQQIVSEGDYSGYDGYDYDYSDPRSYSGEGAEGAYPCKLCGKSYKTPGSLKNHRSLYHRDLISNRKKQSDLEIFQNMLM